MAQLFHEVLYRPLFNALIFLYSHVTFGDLGLAIIILTIVIRFILYPLFYKSFRNQALMQRLQPEVKKIQERHRDNREEQTKALLGLYKAHRVNPMGSFLLIFAQLPILIALYRVFLNGFAAGAMADLYSFIAPPTAFTGTFLGLLDLSKPSIVVVVLAALTQYFQARLSLPPKVEGDESASSKVSRQMVFIAPVLTVVVLLRLPAAIGLYWITTSVFSAVQQKLINRSLKDLPLPHGTISAKSETAR